MKTVEQRIESLEAEIAFLKSTIIQLQQSTRQFPPIPPGNYPPAWIPPAPNTPWTPFKPYEVTCVTLNGPFAVSPEIYK